MRRTHKVARKVQALLPGKFGCVGEIVFNPTDEYVVNGVIIDGTSYKDTVVAKRLQHVFFEADPTLRLTYSRNIYNLADPAQVTFIVGPVDELASQVATSLIACGVATEILQPYTLRDFLDQQCPGGLPLHDEGRRSFELSCAAFLVGDTEQARAGFKIEKRLWDKFIDDCGGLDDDYERDRYRECCEVAALLDGSDSALRQHIIDNVTRNAAALGFQAVGTGG